MALHLDAYSRDGYPSLDGYTSYSDSSTPRTPSPRDDAHYHPAVFTGDNDSHSMHSDSYQPWNGHDAFSFGHHGGPRDAYEGKRPSDSYMDHSAEPSYNGKGTPDMRPHDLREDGPGGDPRGQDIRGADMHSPPRSEYHTARRATFPYVRQDRDRDGMPMDYPPFLQQPPPGSGMYDVHDEPGYPHPPHHPGGSPHGSYHEYDHQQPYYRPHPHYGHPMPPMSHPMHHGHPLSMTYISPHTGLPVQHTDDAASKETQYLRRRCFNCHTTEPPSWRRSTLNPGKIVCNKCGLYERTHLRPRPLRFDELRAGNKARKTGPSAKSSKKAQAAAAPPPVHNGGGLEDMNGKGGEPRDYNLVRRSSVSSSGSSSNGRSDWDSAYSSSSGSGPASGPSTTFSSPASGHYPLSRGSHSPPLSGEGIRLPNAPLSALGGGGSHHSSPLITHQSPHMMSHPPPPPPNGSAAGPSPQLLHHNLPPRKHHTSPYPQNSGLGAAHYRDMNGSSHSLHSNGDVTGSPEYLAASPAGSN